MDKRLLLAAALAFGLAGCAGPVPYRTAGYDANPKCRDLYDRHDDITPENKAVTDTDRNDPCWLRAHEERDDYDLLTIEFDDQGWVQGSSDLARPSKDDHLDKFFKRLSEIYEANRKNGLSLILFIHGWHHNADAKDRNVTEFRWLLRDFSIAEGGRRLAEKTGEGSGPRLVGIYVGWRGESITVPYLNMATFWDRKNTAERVAQGSVRELFSRLDYFRDRARTNVRLNDLARGDVPGQGERNVRMLTIGHSFGGLITYEALSSDFVGFAARASDKDFVSRLGDVVVIVNPAVEGARHEALMVAAQRVPTLKPDQLPVVIVATSAADSATRVYFRWAREVSTLLERTPGREGESIVKAVGHNDRYRTHELKPCEKNDDQCKAACSAPRVTQRLSTKDMDKKAVDDYTFRLTQDIGDEFELMRSVVAGGGFKKKQYLCSGLRLEATPNQVPEKNPFWVVSTTEEIMEDHNDIFNRNFVSFIRQMYLGLISVRFAK